MGDSNPVSKVEVNFKIAIKPNLLHRLNVMKIRNIYIRLEAQVSTLQLVILHSVAAIFPVFITISLLVLIEGIGIPAESEALDKVIYALIVAPWLETILFFGPFLIFRNRKREWTTRFLILLAAIIFTTAHIFSDTSLQSSIFVFWGGLVMANLIFIGYEKSIFF